MRRRLRIDVLKTLKQRCVPAGINLVFLLFTVQWPVVPSKQIHAFCSKLPEHGVKSIQS